MPLGWIGKNVFHMNSLDHGSQHSDTTVKQTTNLTKQRASRDGDMHGNLHGGHRRVKSYDYHRDGDVSMDLLLGDGDDPVEADDEYQEEEEEEEKKEYSVDALNENGVRSAVAVVEASTTKLLELISKAGGCNNDASEGNHDNTADVYWAEALAYIEKNPEQASIPYRNSVQKGREEHYHPLHLACHYLGSESTTSICHQFVLKLLSTYPIATQYQDHSGRLPLHIICWKGVGVRQTSLSVCNDAPQGSILSAFVDAHQDGLAVKDKYGRLPLHIACQFGVLGELDMKLLLDSYPEARLMKSQLGFTPYDVVSMYYPTEDKDLKERILHLLEINSQSHVGKSSKSVSALKDKFNSLQTSSTINSSISYDGKIEGNTILYDFIVSGSWENVIGRCAEYRRDAHTWYVEEKEQGEGSVKSVKILPIHRACEVSDVPVKVIHSLITAFPSSLQCKDHSGRLPLHSACWKGCSREVIELLANHYKRGLSETDSHKSLPLHIACQFGASVDTIEVLLNLNPNSINIKDGLKMDALEIAEYHYNSNKYEMIQFLKNFKGVPSAPVKNEISTEKRTTNTFPLSSDNIISGDTTLYRLIDERNWDKAIRRCRRYSSETHIWFEEKTQAGILQARLLPIHLACILQPSTDLIRELITAYPESTSLKDHSGRTPLHSAAWKDANEKIVQALINSDKSCLSLVDNQGRLPLHVACEFGASVNLVNVLVDNSPNTIFERDSLGRNALAITSKSYFYNRFEIMSVLEKGLWSSSKVGQKESSNNNLSSSDVITQKPSTGPTLYMLINEKAGREKIVARLREYPHEARKWTQKRKINNPAKIEWKLLPIHRLCEMKPKLAMVKSLVKAYPQGLLLPDHHGRLPLHSLCKNCKNVEDGSLDVIQFLISTEQKSLRCRDMRGRLPLHVAVEYGAPKIVIEALLQRFPSGAAYCDTKGRFPLHIASKQGADKMSIFNIFWCYQEALIKRDTSGNLPIDYAKMNDLKASYQVVELLAGFIDKYFVKYQPNSKAVSWSYNVSTYDYDDSYMDIPKNDEVTFDEKAIQTSNTFDAQTSKDFSTTGATKKRNGNSDKKGMLLSAIRRVTSGPM